uniref:Uncharacterized protein n=1 Tax=Ignisphaera aggregans TaxID=334771 RepID=A0A7C2Z8S6_9CREN
MVEVSNEVKSGAKRDIRNVIDPSILGKFKQINIDQGITVFVNGIRKKSGEFLDEVAAAIVAIKMYIRSRKKRRLCNQSKGGTQSNGKNLLWFKAWLGEISKEFDLNPYIHKVSARRRSYFLY